ncbi:MAG: chromosome segregation protein SMC [Ignavibacteria bacterium]
MYLSKLELFGFKSFANKTVVNFNKGVTSIVGPNGCGKTNIVDAIRWCLGEQKSSTLRSDKMENVIFNGTQKKKPMGMAEVSLSLINDKGLLPTEYNEVTITRRIFRSGESEYLLNRNLCRLKDITNLFMDTGMGTNAYSVIELKMVETILSNKAEERRNMFEEAAGVNKYKLRRRISLKKLEEVKNDLTRVNDIVSEVEKQVNSLERQAKKADKYNKVTSVLRGQEIDLAEREYVLWDNKRATYKEQKETAFTKKIQIESELRRLEDELSILREEITSIENELRIKRIDISVQTEKIHAIENSISVSEERRKSLERNLVRYRQELEELHLQFEDTENNIFESAEKISLIGTAIKLKETKIEATITEIEEKNKFLEEKRSLRKIHSDSIFEKFKDVTQKENELSNLDKALSTIDSNIEKLEKKIVTTADSLAKTICYLEELGQKKGETEKELTRSEELYEKKETEKKELEKELASLKDKELEERGILNALNDKIDFIRSLINNLEGVSKGARALMESDSWTDKEKMFLADVGNAEEDYRLALEGALRNILNSLLIESLSDLQKAVDYLRSNDLGKASFYVIGLNAGRKRTILDKWIDYRNKKSINEIEKETEFIGWAESFIQTNDKWQPFFKEILYKIAVTKDLDAAFELSRKYPDFSFTTLNGDFLDKKGFVDAGSASKLNETLFGRRRLLDNLRDELPKYEGNLQKLKSVIEYTEKLINEINLKYLSEQNRILINDFANIEKQMAQFEFERKRASDETDKIKNEISESLHNSNQLKEQENILSIDLKTEHGEKQKADELLKELESEVKLAVQEYNTSITGQNQIKLELERQIGERKNLENSIVRAETFKESINRTALKREFDISTSSAEIVSLNETIEDKLLDLDELKSIRKKLATVESEIDQRLRIVRSQALELEKKIQENRKERDRVSDAIHSADIKNNEINLKIDNLMMQIKENYSVTLELKEFDNLEMFDFTERTNEVHSLKQQLKILGPINLLAYSEYEEEKERLDFLHKQRGDLIESEKYLIRTIEEINLNAQNLFMETFSQIRDNFVKIFRNLFNPGDEADLKIEEGVDPLEARIEIIAKPKGKRPTSIELLSGGEKTLTATALLFAIYLVKPSPFCILDEVDAPLDDANIDRFTRIIKEFSTGTQFIIVTHNKRTMESAETLYGVTIQEEGISKLVSVRFNDDFGAFLK